MFKPVITRADLASYLHEFLGVSKIKDYAPNGLQIEGRAEIRRICTAVTASQAALQSAYAQKADALLVHHGYFWRGEDPVVSGIKRSRLSFALAKNINLYAYHLPLDLHSFLGNNVCFGQILGVEDVKTQDAGQTPGLLMTGRLKKPISTEDLSARLALELGRAPLVLAPSSKPLSYLAWCTGAAQDYIEDAYRLGVDAYLSGEVSLRTYYEAHELSLPYFSCGHHATERYGIEALGVHLEEKFGISHHFIPCDNPI